MLGEDAGFFTEFSPKGCLQIFTPADSPLRHLPGVSCDVRSFEDEDVPAGIDEHRTDTRSEVLRAIAFSWNRLHVFCFSSFSIIPKNHRSLNPAKKQKVRTTHNL